MEKLLCRFKQPFGNFRTFVFLQSIGSALYRAFHCSPLIRMQMKPWQQANDNERQTFLDSAANFMRLETPNFWTLQKRICLEWVALFVSVSCDQSQQLHVLQKGRWKHMAHFCLASSQECCASYFYLNISVENGFLLYHALFSLYPVWKVKTERCGNYCANNNMKNTEIKKTAKRKRNYL